jgi:copper chaperone CopZ
MNVLAAGTGFDTMSALPIFVFAKGGVSMRKVFAVVVVLVGLGALQAEPVGGKKVEVKGPHICCKQCVKVVGGILEKVDGVSDAKCDVPTKTITFTAKDADTAKNAVKALVEGGFWGTATVDGKDLPLPTAKAAKDKAAEVTVQKVHVCCGMCQNAIKDVFKDAKVTFSQKGPQRDVTVTGTDLTPASVLDALHKAGFTGTIK